LKKHGEKQFFPVIIFGKTFKKFNLHQADSFFMISKRVTFWDLSDMRISFDKPISSSSSSDTLDELIPSLFSKADTNFSSVAFLGLITKAFIGQIYLKSPLHTTLVADAQLTFLKLGIFFFFYYRLLMAIQKLV